MWDTRCQDLSFPIPTRRIITVLMSRQRGRRTEKSKHDHRYILEFLKFSVWCKYDLPDDSWFWIWPHLLAIPINGCWLFIVSSLGFSIAFFPLAHHIIGILVDLWGWLIFWPRWISLHLSSKTLLIVFMSPKFQTSLSHTTHHTTWLHF